MFVLNLVFVSSVFVLTLTDVMAFFSFLGLASIVLL